ncbi:MAG: PD40 domain-containing protein, partial [Bacteroidetes bacterium]|nr:PD40 domain-containing protein [Bacteroidota bacterium]
MIFFAILLNSALFAQDFSSETELKKKARELFKNEDYITAAPYFSQLLSIYPKEPEYNYKYGASLIYSDVDKEKSLKYLEIAAKSEIVEPQFYYFLAKAYQLNYRFSNAIEAYQKFIDNSNSKLRNKYQPEREIEMCQNGKQLIRNITQLIVLEKKEVGERDFFRSYNLGAFGGKILVKPDDFKSALDIKLKEKSIMFLPDLAGDIYFASYGDNAKNGKDIYKIRKLLNGEWSEPESLGLPINTAYDEDYPFMHPNGRTLYFSSKGHNSMGGYDIFKSELNLSTGTWSKPVNHNFAINSPDDDILFITDAEQKYAYFSSSRASIDKNITLYKVDIGQNPDELILVSGKLLADGFSLSSATLKIYDEENNVIALYNPDAKDGSFFIKLPNGGTFKYTLEKSGMKILPQLVEIAFVETPKPVKQLVELVNDKGNFKLKVTTSPEEEFTDDDFQNALAVIKQQANLDVNYNNPELINRYK